MKIRNTAMRKAQKEVIQSSQWHQLSIKKIAWHLETDLKTGLTQSEVVKRQSQFCANELKGKPGTSPFVKFLQQFKAPLLHILLITCALKAIIGQWVNAWVIWGITLINAIIGFIQESKAQSTIAALASSVQTNATIFRNGKKIQVPSTELVPGDLVLLASGDKVPADLRLVETRNLQVNESGLTGESIAIEKNSQPLNLDIPLAERTNMAYAGSFVTFGTGSGIVVAIGEATETGRISQLIEQGTSLKTPLTRKFDKFSWILLYIILSIVALTFGVGLGYGNSWAEMFEAAVAFAVSAIPEGLPAVVTVTLAIGVERMARRHAIVRKLPAVETLAGATVICSDKTSTLTENQMTVQAIYAGGQNYTVTGVGYASSGEVLLNKQQIDLNNSPVLVECLVAGVLCNDARLEQEDGQWQVIGDPQEGALIAVASKVGVNRSNLERESKRIDVIPFESDFQYMATLHQGRNNTIYIKGSQEAILKRSKHRVNAEGTLVPLQAFVIH